MDAEMPKYKRLVIVGASGMVGGYALRYSLENPAVASVLALGRRPLGISHPKLNEVLHRDFNDCSRLPGCFPAKTRLSFAWEHIRGRSPTRNYARSL